MVWYYSLASVDYSIDYNIYGISLRWWWFWKSLSLYKFGTTVWLAQRSFNRLSRTRILELPWSQSITLPLHCVMASLYILTGTTSILHSTVIAFSGKWKQKTSFFYGFNSIDLCDEKISKAKYVSNTCKIVENDYPPVRSKLAFARNAFTPENEKL